MCGNHATPFGALIPIRTSTSLECHKDEINEAYTYKLKYSTYESGPNIL